MGPFLIRPFVRDDDLRTIFWGIAAAFAIFSVTYAFVPLMPIVWLAGLLVFAGHLGGGVQWTLSTYALQLIVPDRLRGRIFAFDEALISVTIALSATVSGWAADRYGVRATMLVLAALAGAYTITWTIATSGVRRSLAPGQAQPRAA
jgi:MFS family permease